MGEVAVKIWYDEAVNFKGDPWATDTADPARIFREMFPSPAPLPDWRLFVVFEDLITRGVIERVRSI